MHIVFLYDTALHCTLLYAHIADVTHSCEAHASARCESCVNCVDKCVHGVEGVEESKGVVCEYSQCTWNSHHSLHAQHASRTELHLQAMQLPVDAYFDAIVSD